MHSTYQPDVTSLKTVPAGSDEPELPLSLVLESLELPEFPPELLLEPELPEPPEPEPLEPPPELELPPEAPEPFELPLLPELLEPEPLELLPASEPEDPPELELPELELPVLELPELEPLDPDELEDAGPSYTAYATRA